MKMKPFSLTFHFTCYCTVIKTQFAEKLEQSNKYLSTSNDLGNQVTIIGGAAITLNFLIITIKLRLLCWSIFQTNVESSKHFLVLSSTVRGLILFQQIAFRMNLWNGSLLPAATYSSRVAHMLQK